MATLRTTGATYKNIKKRPHPTDGCCELCGRKKKILAYHHWNLRDYKEGEFIKGIYICRFCHSVIHYWINLGYHMKYEELKRKIENEEAC